MTISAEFREPLAVGALAAGGGLTLALLNLGLARLMAPADFGLVSLVQAVSIGATTLVTLGAADAAQRLTRQREIAPRSLPWFSLLRAVFGRWILPTGTAVAVVAGLWYGWTLSVVVATTILICGIAVSYVSGHMLRANAFSPRGMAVVQAWRFVGSFGVIVLMLVGARVSPICALAVLSGASLFAGTLGVMGVRSIDTGLQLDEYLWRKFRSDARVLLSISLSLAGLYHADKLLIPILLSLEDLAIYSVAGWVVITPFLLVQTVIGFTLVPRLRRTAAEKESRRIIRRYVLFTFGVAIPLGTAIAAATPMILPLLYADVYLPSVPLIASLTVLGVVRTCYSLPAAAVSAWAEGSDLELFNWWGWISLLVALAAMVAGVHQVGLMAIPLGLTAGVGVRLGAAVVTARRSLKTWVWTRVAPGR
jgi:O-antigen/teichoic acid export membrane protein